MNKLGSEFLKEFDHYERPIAFGLTKRLLVLLIGIALIASGTILISLLGLSDIFTYILAMVLAPPFAIYGLGLDGALKEKALFYLKIQKRSYMTEFEKGDELHAEDFRLWKKVKETEQRRESEESSAPQRDESEYAKYDSLYKLIRKWINAYRQK